MSLPPSSAPCSSRSWLIHVLWAAGVTCGRDEMFPGGQNDASLSLTFASVVGAAAGTAVIFVTRSWTLNLSTTWGCGQ